MLSRVDRIQIASASAVKVAKTLERLFGARVVGRDHVACLNANRVRLQLGESFVEALEPAGPGPVADFISKWESGLFAAGFAAEDMKSLERSLAAAGANFTREGEQLFLQPTPVGGLRAVISPDVSAPAPDADCALTHIYEVTNPVADLKTAVDFYVRAFGLDPAPFQPIGSTLYGYDGTLTLFSGPPKLDRIEVTQTYDPEKAMGRFHGKRGDSLYMCFAETRDFEGLKRRLDAAQARYAVRQPEDGAPNVLFIHPRSLCGMLMGVSLEGVAWEWSSGPKRAHGAHA